MCCDRQTKNIWKKQESLSKHQERENLIKKVLPGLLTVRAAREALKKVVILLEMCYE